MYCGLRQVTWRRFSSKRVQGMTRTHKDVHNRRKIFHRVARNHASAKILAFNCSNSLSSMQPASRKDFKSTRAATLSTPVRGRFSTGDGLCVCSVVAGSALLDAPAAALQLARTQKQETRRKPKAARCQKHGRATFKHHVIAFGAFNISELPLFMYTCAHQRQYWSSGQMSKTLKE